MKFDRIACDADSNLHREGAIEHCEARLGKSSEAGHVAKVVVTAAAAWTGVTDSAQWHAVQIIWQQHPGREQVGVSNLVPVHR